MGFLKILSFVLVSVLGVGLCAFVDTLTKCSKDDAPCHTALIGKILKNISAGVAEFDIPAIDPIILENLDIPLGELTTLHVSKVTATGIKDCNIDSLDINIDKLQVALQVTCDLVLEGTYEANISDPTLTALFNGTANGNGNGRIAIDKVTVNMQFPFEIENRGGDTFLTSHSGKYTYTYVIKDKVTFAADSIYLGGIESSRQIIKLMNENWKLIIDLFGKPVIEIALNIFRKFLLKFVNSIPTKYYMIEDISSLAH